MPDSHPSFLVLKVKKHFLGALNDLIFLSNGFHYHCRSDLNLHPFHKRSVPFWRKSRHSSKGEVSLHSNISPNGSDWATVFLSHKPLYAHNLEPKHCHQGSRAPLKSTLAPAVSTIGPALCQNPLTNCHWWLTANLANTKSTTHTKEITPVCHKRLMSHFLLMSLPSPFSY